ncbi:EAL domain-containing protein [Halorhodospira sp. 9621]|uniref:putative bifunctional diguanylate cyclase/phosphodiesterase n=1 Tax=Halorhodospira sp. 9621 TaxID=2899135 RepID=UPI001EE8B722|nr:EAL domain-containing protein [Halorhodospira sp. 9621]
MASETWLRALGDGSLRSPSVGLLLVDAHNRITPLNPAGWEFVGRGSDVPVAGSQLAWRLQGTRKDPAPVWPWERLLSNAPTEKVIEESLYVLCPEHQSRVLYCCAARRDGQGGAEPEVVVAIDDQTARCAAEWEHQLLLEFLEALPDYIGIAEANGRLLYHNEAMRNAQGRVGKEESFSVRLVEAHGPESLQCLLNEAIPTAEQTGLWLGQTRLKHQGLGTELPVEQLVIAHRDEQGAVVRYSTLMRDLSERHAHESEIERLLYRDPITGLPNRMLFHDRIEQAQILQGQDEPWLAVIVCDLRGFASINGSRGQDFGDQVLAAIGARLRELLPQTATIGRLGGDQFGVLLPQLRSSQAAVDFVERIVGKVGDPLEVSGEPVQVSLRAGITLTASSLESAYALMDQADAARRESKQSGSRYQFFRDEFTKRAREQVDLSTKLRGALDAGDLAVHYQPQVNLRTGRLLGVEALVRWHHPEEGWISPGRFIPVAEWAGLIRRVGEQVLDRAGEQYRIWSEQGGAPGWLAVNLAAPQMEVPGWSDELLAQLARIGMAPEALELEITESLMVEPSATIISELTFLREHGVRVAVDDFGTGYSSLHYLTQLPVDRVKIDRSFVADMAECRRKAAVVESIVTLGERLGMDVLAEGIETEAQRSALLGAGCRQGQGFLFSAAVPGEDFQSSWRECARSATGTWQ